MLEAFTNLPYQLIRFITDGQVSVVKFVAPIYEPSHILGKGCRVLVCSQ